jgi:hypothetical protein
MKDKHQNYIFQTHFHSKINNSSCHDIRRLVGVLNGFCLMLLATNVLIPTLCAMPSALCLILLETQG